MLSLLALAYNIVAASLLLFEALKIVSRLEELYMVIILWYGI